jgi:hypothetical protein
VTKKLLLLATLLPHQPRYYAIDVATLKNILQLDFQTQKKNALEQD